MARELSSVDWRGLVAPSLAVFEQMSDEAWRRLPARFRDLCGDIVVRIEDFATDEILDEMDIDDPFELMGLYQGVSLDKQSVSDVPQSPNMIFLYRRPILDHWSEGEETLGDLITHVLIHEVGHHFGLSDADMEEIEDEALGA